MKRILTETEIDRIIGIAWEDRTSFDVIKDQFGVSEAETIKIMRTNMKPSSFRMWRRRVTGRKTKHRALAGEKVTRFVSPDQRHRDRTF